MRVQKQNRMFKFLLLSALMTASIVGANPREKRFTSPVDLPAPNTYSWIGYLQNDRQIWCTGFMVSPTHLMTSAHCLEDKDTVGLSFVFGNIQNPFAVGAVRYIRHPWYDGSAKHDVAIVELETPIPHTVPNIDYAYDCGDLFWGNQQLRSAGYAGKDTLKKANIFKPSVCPSTQWWGRYFGMSQGGDSGSPLFYEGVNQTLNVIGVLHGQTPTQIVWEALRYDKNFIQQFLTLDKDDDGRTNGSTSRYLDSWTEVTESPTSNSNVIGVSLMVPTMIVLSLFN